MLATYAHRVMGDPYCQRCERGGQTKVKPENARGTSRAVEREKVDQPEVV